MIGDPTQTREVLIEAWKVAVQDEDLKTLTDDQLCDHEREVKRSYFLMITVYFVSETII